MLKNVVLPAPFGPIRLEIDFSSSAKSTLLTAINPPNRLVTPRASRIAAIASGANAAQRAIDQRVLAELVEPFGSLGVQFGRSLSIGENPLWPRHHQNDQRDAEDHVLELGQVDLQQ